jgi:hypothetical protein
MNDKPITNVGPDQQDEAHDIAHEHAQRVAEGARNLQASINSLGAGPKKTFDTSLMQMAFAEHEIVHHGADIEAITTIPEDCLRDVRKRYEDLSLVAKPPRTIDRGDHHAYPEPE